jgi:hypothetical protein
MQEASKNAGRLHNLLPNIHLKQNTQPGFVIAKHCFVKNEEAEFETRSFSEQVL